MPFIWAALMPHPPIIIPEVGKGREREASPTLSGAGRLCEKLSAVSRSLLPDVILALSPHQPYTPGSLFINTAPAPRGSLARFGAPQVTIAATTPQDALAELKEALELAGIPASYGQMPDITQDHGSIVPLRILSRCFQDATPPPVITAGPSGLSPELALKLGETLAAMPGERRWALLASGDLSHRLKEDGPYGFNPAGPEFDRTVVSALEKGDPAPLARLSQEFCEKAGECGLRPVLTLLALTRAPLDVLSYEGPFGVGYCNALWLSPEAEESAAAAPDARAASGGDEGGHPYARLARMAVAAHLAGRPEPGRDAIAALSPEAELWAPHKGCFVSIKNPDGSLRGCIGTFLPTRESLDLEIMGNAVSAATRDPRFPPMSEAELAKARISVDVLNTPEPVSEGMELDPAVYGVIISKGGRRGLLLPALEGVTSVEQQIAIAARKGGIADLDGALIHRFTVDRYYEDKNS